MGEKIISLMMVTIYSGHRYREELHGFLKHFQIKYMFFLILYNVI